MRIIITLLALAVMASCNNEESKKESSSKAKELAGEWNNLSRKIAINSKNNTDSTDVFAVERPDWEKTLQIKPIRTFFRADSTWNSAHLNLSDSIIYNPSGKWWIDGEALVMLQQFPSIDTSRYSIEIRKDSCFFRGMVDWDGDGKKDDEYTGWQIRK